MFKKVKKFLKALGPGIVTGASDDDPSGISTYSQGGAKYGLAALWTVIITIPLMAAVHDRDRIRLTTTLRKHYPKWVLYLLIIFSVPAIVLNIGAYITDMNAVEHLIFPAVHAIVFSVLFTGVPLFFIIYLPYSTLGSVQKYLFLTPMEILIGTCLDLNLGYLSFRAYRFYLRKNYAG